MLPWLSVRFASGGRVPPHPGAGGDALPLSRGHERRCRHRAVRGHAGRGGPPRGHAMPRGRGSPTDTRSCARGSGGWTATNRNRRSSAGVEVPLTVHDLRDLSGPAQADRLAELLVADRRAGFSTGRRPRSGASPCSCSGRTASSSCSPITTRCSTRASCGSPRRRCAPTTPSGTARSPSSSSAVPTASTSSGCTSISTLTGSRPRPTTQSCSKASTRRPD